MGAIKSMEGRFDCHPGGSYALIYVTPCGNALEFDEDDLREYLVSGDSDKPWYTKRSGVNGRHEMNVFMKDTAGQINIVSMRQHPTVKGITTIDYQGPVREPDGKIVDWRNMKADGTPYTKNCI